MALPNSDITTTMVGSELGTSSRDVGYLCRHPNINKWSKWKPVRHTTLDPITETQLQNVNYGLNIPTFSSVQSYVNSVRVGGSGGVITWDYLPLRASDPKRLGDFRNYNKDAVSPIGGTTVTKNTTPKESTVGAILTGDGTPYQIGWEDIIGTKKLGMVLASGSDIIKTAVANNSQSSIVTMDNFGISDGVYQAYLFFTNSTGGLTNISGVPMTHRYGHLVNIATPNVRLTVTASWMVLEPNKLNIKVIVTNTSVTPVNFLNCACYVRFGHSEDGSPLLQHERNVGVPGTITAPITDQFGLTIFNESITINRDEAFSWKVYWRNTGAYPNEFAINILTPMD